VLFGANMLGLSPILLSGDLEAIQRFVKPISESWETDQPRLAALAATEPGMGSDFIQGHPGGKARTRVERKGDGYLINGRKVFISNGSLASLVTVFASHDADAPIRESTSCFAVPTDSPGFAVGQVFDKMGQRACPAAELLFDDVFVPEDHLIGKERGGWELNRLIMSVTRTPVATIALGIARAAYDRALAYAAERVQGGQAIVRHQAIQLLLADMSIRVEAARGLVWRSAASAAAGKPSLKLASMAKTFASDAAVANATDAIQVLGGNGYMREYGVEKHQPDQPLRDHGERDAGDRGVSARTMRAARFHGADQPLRIEDVPYPEPGPDDAVVRLAACGICASDLHFLEGMPTPEPPPITLGHEPAGVIDSLGANVRGWSPGERVAIHIGAGCGACRSCSAGRPNCCVSLQAPGLHIDGAFAEAIRVSAATLARVPEGVSLEAAAVATDCVTSPYHALTCRGGLEKGERLVVIGVGGLGGQAVQLARHLGAAQVVALDVSSAALERAKRGGATETVLATQGEDATVRLREITSGGADLVLECVGTPETVAAGVNALHPGGRLVVVGVGMQPPRIDLPQALFAFTELSLLGSFGSHLEDLDEVLRLEAAGEIDIESAITHRLPLEEAAAGLEILRTKRGDPDRIVLQIGDWS
jgi:2-desacetyl-2-hydroxyethyl bacteriochlorophyllide A dehydrogenase